MYLFARLKRVPFKVYCKCKASRWIRVLTVLLSAVVVTFLVARNIFLVTLTYGDCPLIKLFSGKVLEEYIFSVWHRAAHGECYPSPQGYLFLYLFSQIAWYMKDISIFNFFMNLSFPLSFIAFYEFSKRFCESIWARFFAATLYIINPVVITYYNFGGFMWALVFLPLALLFFIDLLEKPAMKNLAGAAAFVNLVIWVFPTFSVIFLIALFVIATSYLIFASSKTKFIKDTAPKLLLLGLLIIMCNAPYFFAEWIYLNSPSYGFEKSSVLRDFQFTYKELTLLNFIRFAGNAGSPQVPLGYNDPSNLANEAGLIIPIIMCAGILFAWRSPQNKKLRIRALLVVIFTMIIFVLILRLIIYSELKWIIENMPALWTLRNPIKLQLMFAVCMIPFLAFSTERIAVFCMDFFRKNELKKAALTLTLTLLALSHVYPYNYFVFKGCMGLDRTYGNLQNVSPDRTISDIVEDSLHWYVDQNYRGIILPFDHQTELHVQFINPLLYTGRLGTSSKIVNVIDNELKSGANLTNLFRLLSIKYVYINKAWEDTGFHIIQPQNLESIKEDLEKESMLEAEQSGYSKFVIEPVLPRLYLSQYPILYSNIETIKFVNSSIFSYNPVFFGMKYDGCQIYFTSTPIISRSYSWELPLSGVFDAKVIVYGNQQNSTVYFSLDGVKFQNKTIYTAPCSLETIGRFELKDGFNKLFLFTKHEDSFLDMKDFHVEGLCDIENNLVRIQNGLLMTENEYDNFDLNVDFKPVKFGEKSWHGPNIYFAFTNSSYFRIIFHEDNYVEIAKKTPDGYIEGIIVKQASLTSGNWYNLRVIKVDKTLTLYLNGEYLLSFTSPLLSDKGRIGLGSENSVTYFKNFAISKDVIAGIWLIPTENPGGGLDASVIKMDPGMYILQFNQTNSSWYMLVLNENYDPRWEATMDGTVLKKHCEANFYASCWFINVSQGIHKLEIYYKPNTLYSFVLFMSMVTIGVVLGTLCIPVTLLRKIRSLFKKRVLFGQKLETKCLYNLRNGKFTLRAK